MAFYATRVDDTGNEVDCYSIGSARTLMPESLKSLPEDGSSVTLCDSPRFRNESDDFRSVISGDSTLREHYTYRMEDEEDSHLDSELELETGRQLQPEHEPDSEPEDDLHSNIVPPLDLRSEMDLSMDVKPTFSCHKAKLNCKVITESNRTYELWLAKKREAQLNEMARRKKERERRQLEMEERKRLAEEQYKNWLEKKRQLAISKKQQKAVKTTRSSSSWSSSTSSSSSSSTSSSSSSSTISISPGLSLTTVGAKNEKPNAEKQRKIEEWERSKRKQEEMRRKREKQEAEERARLEAKRKEQSAEAYNRWVKRNKNCPKPVPMNQGILSLRGTISDIYVNPNEWKSILED